MKAILVLDEMPKNCRECLFEGANSWKWVKFCIATPYQKMICKNGENTDENSKPNWCPLKELPERKSTYIPKIKKEADELGISRDYNGGFYNGWNACLDKILGTED